MKGHTTAIVTPEAQAKSQICIVAALSRPKVLSLLRNLWSRVSSFTNYQAALCDFDWEEESFKVSIFDWPFANCFELVLTITVLCLGYLSTLLQPCRGGHC